MAEGSGVPATRGGRSSGGAGGIVNVAGRIAVTTGEVLTEYNMFKLFDSRAPRTSDASGELELPSGADLVAVRNNAVTFYSGLAK